MSYLLKSNDIFTTVIEMQSSDKPKERKSKTAINKVKIPKLS